MAKRAKRELDPNGTARDEDWQGNNAAFSCPVCGKVFIVSGHLHGSRSCPSCKKSRGHVEGGRQTGGRAWIDWPAGS